MIYVDFESIFGPEKMRSKIQMGLIQKNTKNMLLAVMKNMLVAVMAMN